METHDIYYVYQNGKETKVLNHKKALSLGNSLIQKGYKHIETINAIEFIKHYYNN